MSSGIRNTLIACGVFMVVVVGLFVNNIVRSPAITDDQLRDDFGTMILPEPRATSGFELLRHDETAFTESDLEGQWTFSYFGFTHCPDICPVTLSVLAEARRQLQEAGETPFEVVLFTVDPARDTPEVLAEFVDYFDPEFVGVTGAHSVIAQLAREVSVGFAQVPAEGEPDGYVVDHTGNIVVFNPRGHYHGYIRLPHRPDRIVTSFREIRQRF